MFFRLIFNTFRPRNERAMQISYCFQECGPCDTLKTTGFGAFSLGTKAYRLSRGQKAMAVSALQLELLAYLAALPGRLPTWGDERLRALANCLEMRSAVFFTGPAVSGYARDSRVTGEAPRVRPDRKCGLRNRFPASRPHHSGRLRASVGA